MRFRKFRQGRNLVLCYKDLRKVVSALCTLPLDDRKNIQGINPERADIIVGGAAILDTIMEEFGCTPGTG